MLDEQTQLSYRLFEYGANLKIEGYKYQWHNYPVNQMFGTHADLPAFMINIHTVKDSNDAKAYIARLVAFQEVFAQLIKNLKIREEKQIIAPKFVFPMVISDCKNILKGIPFEKNSKVKSTLLFASLALISKEYLPPSKVGSCMIGDMPSSRHRENLSVSGIRY